MKKYISALVALCMLLAMCMPSFAEDYAAHIESQFRWGISADEYISAYELTSYEKMAMSDTASMVATEGGYYDSEDALFINDQYIGSMAVFYNASEDEIFDLKITLESMFGHIYEGGAERMYYVINAVAPVSFSSPNEFGECYYAEIADSGYVGFVCNYFDDPIAGDHYCLLVVNETLLYSLTGGTVPLIPAEEPAAKQFSWGIGIDAYIAEHGITDYEIQALSDTVSLLHENIAEYEYEDSIFVNNQYVGGIYDCWYADEAKAAELTATLESQFGYSTEGGADRMFAIMNTLVPGLYTSADDFSNCVYAETPDGEIFGCVCSYNSGDYVLMIMNERLLFELVGGEYTTAETAPDNTASEPETAPTDSTGSAPVEEVPADNSDFSIGGGLSSGSTPTDSTGSAPVEAAPADNTGFSIGGGLSSGDASTDSTGSTTVEVIEEIPADNSGFSIGGGLSSGSAPTDSTGSAPVEAAPADNTGFSIGGGLSSGSTSSDEGSSSGSGGLNIGGGF